MLSGFHLSARKYKASHFFFSKIYMALLVVINIISLILLIMKTQAIHYVRNEMQEVIAIILAGIVLILFLISIFHKKSAMEGMRMSSIEIRKNKIFLSGYSMASIIVFAITVLL